MSYRESQIARLQAKVAKVQSLNDQALVMGQALPISPYRQRLVDRLTSAMQRANGVQQKSGT